MASSNQQNSQLHTDLYEEISGLINKIKVREQAGLNTQADLFNANVFAAIQTAAQAQEDYASVKTILQQYITAADQWKIVLQDILENITILETRRAKRELYSSRWWQHRQTDLQAVFQADPQTGWAQWLQTYVEILLAWELDLCNTMLNDTFPIPDSVTNYYSRIREGTQAITSKDYEQALVMLSYLVQAKLDEQPQYVLDNLSRALLNVLSGRICLYMTSQSDVAFHHFEQANELAPADGRTAAALGEYYRNQQDNEQALAFFQQARENSPTQPDGYIGMGLYFEDQDLWDDAEEWYEKAFELVYEEKDCLLALCKLLAPANGRVYLVAARALHKKGESERALLAVDRAITVGIKQGEENRLELGYQVKGEILKAWQRPLEAAQAFYEAGWRSGHNIEYPKAVDLLRQAIQMDENFQPAYWYLSENLRLLAETLEDSNRQKKDELIQESLAVWEQGATQGEIKSRDAWALFARAMLCEVIPERRSADPQDVYLYDWQAVLFAERKLILSDTNAYDLAFAGRFYPSLNLDANVLVLLELASKLDPNDETVREARIVHLTNHGEYKAAEELLQPWLEDTTHKNHAWARWVKGYILSRSSQAPEALTQSLELSHDYNSNFGWIRLYRTFCHLLLGNISEAIQQLEGTWNKVGKEATSELTTSARAGLYLYLLKPDDHESDLDAATEFARRAMNDPIEPFEAHFIFGCCMLVKNELDEANRSLIKGISQTNNRHELMDCIGLEIPILIDLMDKLPQADELINILNNIRSLMRDQLEAMGSISTSPEDEILQRLDDLNPEKHPNMGDELVIQARLGAKAGLARLYRKSSQWFEALRIYQELLTYFEFIPEALIGLKICYDEMLKIGDEEIQRANFEKAFQSYYSLQRLLVELETSPFPIKKETDFLPPGNLKRKGEIHSKLAFTCLLLEDEHSAQEHFQESTRLLGKGSSPSPGKQIGRTWSLLVFNPPVFWTLWDRLNALQAGESLEEDLRQALEDVRGTLYGKLDNIYQVNESSSELNIPVATPIVLEIGDAIIPVVDSKQDGGKFLYEEIPAMRARIEKDMGVRVTGVRARGSGVAGGKFVIQLDELPVFHGTISMGMNFCPAPSARLVELGIPADSLIPGSEPWTRLEGSWVFPDEAEKIRNAGLELWTEPQYLINQLEAVLRRNLVNFTGFEEVEVMLTSHKKNNPVGAEQLAAIVPDTESKLYFARLLRTLVRENTPIVDLSAILESIRGLRLDAGNLAEAVRFARLALRLALPGNRPGINCYPLPVEWETRIAGWLRLTEESNQFLAPTVEAHELLQELKRSIPVPYSKAVVSVHASEIRPYVRRLLEARFPDLSVMSAEEFTEAHAA